MNFDEYRIGNYEANQLICDVADAVLKLLTEKQLTMRQSLAALKKAEMTIEEVGHTARWGEPLTCGQAQNTALLSGHEYEDLKGKMGRQKDQSDLCGAGAAYLEEQRTLMAAHRAMVAASQVCLADS